MKLVKKIVSKTGVIHFRRWAVFRSRWFRIYIHEILERDRDSHLHTHPWHFCGMVLMGSYIEARAAGFRLRKKWDVGFRHKDEPHKIFQVIEPTLTIVLAFGKHDDSWGYEVDGGRVQHAKYREMKRANP